MSRISTIWPPLQVPNFDLPLSSPGCKRQQLRHQFGQKSWTKIFTVWLPTLKSASCNTVSWIAIDGKECWKFTQQTNPNLRGWAWEIILWRWSEMIMYLEICNVFFVVAIHNSSGLFALTWSVFSLQFQNKNLTKTWQNLARSPPPTKIHPCRSKPWTFSYRWSTNPNDVHGPFLTKNTKKTLVKHIYAEGLWRQVVCSFAKGVSVWCPLVSMNTMWISSLR